MVRTDLVAKTKPAFIKVYDYYDPGLYQNSLHRAINRVSAAYSQLIR